MNDPWGRRWATPAAFALLWIAVAAVYARVVPGDWVFDDIALWADPARQLDHFSWEGLWRATSAVKSEWTRWIPNATFALNFLWFGHGTASFHVVNIAIHGLAALALFAFVRETLRLDGRSESLAWRVALLTAALFALDPVQTQAVSYIWQRSASLAGLFVFSTMWIFAMGLRRRGGRRALFVAASGTLAFASMFVKQNAIVLAAVMPLYAWLFATRRSVRGLAFASLGLATAGAVAVAVLSAYTWRSGSPLEGLEREFGRAPEKYADRLLTQSRVSLRLASLVVAPHPERLSIDHHVITSRGLTRPWTTAPAVATIAILAAAAIGLARRRPVVSFCIAWYFVTLAPESVIPRLAPMFEHRAYIPSAGPLLLLALGIEWVASGSLARPRLAGAMACLMLALFAAGTWSRNALWTSQLALSEDAARKAPLHPRPHWNVGASWESEARRTPPNTHAREAAWDRAEAGFRRAYELDRGNLHFQDALARVLDERGRGGSAAHIPIWIVLTTDGRRLDDERVEMYEAHDAVMAPMLGAWTSGLARSDGAPDLPSAEALGSSGARAFSLETRLSPAKLTAEGGRIRADCRVRAEIRVWNGADRGSRNRSLFVGHAGVAAAPRGDSGRRDAAIACARDATEKLVSRELTATLARLAWFQDRALRDSANR